MNDGKKLFLLDAYALIYRAYFAFINNPRINSKGINTSAIFGFTNTLLELIKKESPTHLAAVFDTKKPTKRHIDYPDYKAQREAMPEPLQNSLPYIDKVLEAFHIPKLYKDGFEADDVIGTIAKEAEKQGFKVFMMTPDKDFAQLVSDNIFMYRPANKWQSASVWGVPEVLNKFKIQKIDQVIDFLAMTGDAADNIPGIPGVGEKTAQKFIQEYESLEGLFKNSHRLKGKIKEKVNSSRDLALLCKELVTIITDVPLEFNIEEMQIQEQDEEAIQQLFSELEFTNLLKRVLKKENQEQLKLHKQSQTTQIDLFTESESKIEEEKLNFQHTIIKSKNEIQNLTNTLHQENSFALNFITNTSDALTTKIIGFSISLKGNNSYYIPYQEEYINLFQPVFEDPNILKIGFDIKFQIKILKRFDICLKGEIFDIELAHYLLYPEKRHALGILTEQYLNRKLIDKESFIGRGKLKKELTSLKIEVISSYAVQQSSAIFELVEFLNKELVLVGLKKLYTNLETPLIVVLAEMEFEGVNLDSNMLLEYSKLLSDKLQDYINHIYTLAGLQFNISSPKQMGEVLFDKLQLSKKPKKTKSGQYSTSEETLLKLKNEHPIISEILEFRAIKKLLSTYVEALPALVNPLTNRLHTTFNQSVASTGRLSSVNPNLQNIPIRTSRGMQVRKAFIPRSEEYSLLAADYSQIELRIMALLSEDKAMIRAFNEGIDIHSATASKVYKVAVSDVNKTMRSNAKAVNFGIIYGISPFGLAQNIGISRKEAKEIIDQYFEEFSGVKKYMDTIIDQARELKYVETLMGRRRYLPDINSQNAVIRSVAERNAINAPIQGSAADIIKQAMIKIHEVINERGMKSKMVLQVHDELVFDTHNTEREELKEIVKYEMENVIDTKVPLVVDVGEGLNWLAAH